MNSCTNSHFNSEKEFHMHTVANMGYAYLHKQQKKQAEPFGTACQYMNDQ